MMHVGSPDTLNHFQACSIESAALHHPNYNVCLAIQVRIQLLKLNFDKYFEPTADG